MRTEKEKERIEAEKERERKERMLQLKKEREEMVEKVRNDTLNYFKNFQIQRFVMASN